MITGRLLTFFISLAVFLGCMTRDDAGHAKEGEKSSAAVSNVLTVEPRKDKAPDFAWTNDKGKRERFSEFHKKVTVLNFWATWCAPCRKEIPDLIEIHKELGDKGVRVIGVSLDRGADALGKVKKFAADYKINYPVIIDNGELHRLYGGFGSIPTTFIIDKEGKPVEMIVGLRSKEAFVESIKKYL